MQAYLWLIPLLPFVSSVLLMLSAGRLPRAVVALLGAGSVGLAAIIVASVFWAYQGAGEPIELEIWRWMQVNEFSVGFAFYVDHLTLVMMSVITGVGFLIHVYSTEFMHEDSDYSRYFAYMNMFVAAMLILVMADNLLLLYVGWEGVGVCSYLLVGFWYKDAANGAAARKAFIVTRIGDTAMALGLLVLFTHLGTLQIQPMLAAAQNTWVVGDQLPTIAALLLLGGAVGKSAQLPLHTWLPDAMAGPTPVSALIHAATMVTAGVYLIARTHDLFLLSPDAMLVVAWVGLLTLLLAAFTALNQHDIKRILAYSTISQIGYMFLALGVGAWASGIFHLMTHAFFKALLFLGAGAVIHCLHHEHNIFRMGGLRTRLPIVFWSFLIGAAALAALPFTSGFFSKDPILLSAFEIQPALWVGGLIGALLTAIYSFRLVFVVFYGDAQTEPDKQPGWRMAVPLGILCVLALFGGWLKLPLESVFPSAQGHHPSLLIEAVSIGTPLIGLIIALLVYYRKSWHAEAFSAHGIGKSLSQFWHHGWGMDALYDRLWVKPYTAITRWLKPEWLDRVFHSVVALCRGSHALLSSSQTGQLRWYATSMMIGLLLFLSLVGWLI